MVPAEVRREQARGVVAELLRSGRRFEHVSLRDVAPELGVPMSTLTYAYSSITDLMDRKRAEGRKRNAALICLARRRCDVLHAMLKNQTTYQPRLPAAA